MKVASRGAFTPLELFAVIIIIGIVAVIAVPTYKAAKRNGEISQYYATRNVLIGAIQEYRLYHNQDVPDTDRDKSYINPELAEYLPESLNPGTSGSRIAHESPFGGYWYTWPGTALTRPSGTSCEIGVNFGSAISGDDNLEAICTKVKARDGDYAYYYTTYLVYFI